MQVEFVSDFNRLGCGTEFRDPAGFHFATHGSHSHGASTWDSLPEGSDTVVSPGET
jgi:hypothetical protein